jgi:hypothetical protein
MEDLISELCLDLLFGFEKNLFESYYPLEETLSVFFNERNEYTALQEEKIKQHLSKYESLTVNIKTKITKTKTPRIYFVFNNISHRRTVSKELDNTIRHVKLR